MIHKSIERFLEYASMKMPDLVRLENPGMNAPCGQVYLTPENYLFLTPEEFGRRGHF